MKEVSKYSKKYVVESSSILVYKTIPVFSNK